MGSIYISHLTSSICKNGVFPYTQILNLFAQVYYLGVLDTMLEAINLNRQRWYTANIKIQKAGTKHSLLKANKLKQCTLF